VVLRIDDWKFHLQMESGVVVDKSREAGIPIGSELPWFGFRSDVCMDCGCIYAIDLTRMDAKKSLPPIQSVPPGTSQKGKPLINPFSTS